MTASLVAPAASPSVWPRLFWYRGMLPSGTNLDCTLLWHSLGSRTDAIQHSGEVSVVCMDQTHKLLPQSSEGQFSEYVYKIRVLEGGQACGWELWSTAHLTMFLEAFSEDQIRTETILILLNIMTQRDKRTTEQPLSLFRRRTKYSWCQLYLGGPRPGLEKT